MKNNVNLNDLYDSGTMLHNDDITPIAARPVRVNTSNQEREGQRDAGRPMTETHFEWLMMGKCSDEKGYQVRIAKFEGEIDCVYFADFEAALTYFNKWVY
ncbi:hypothetical protein DVA43_02410 [Leclercia sp. W6]|uniref:hypothetical protein n=1 Tax=Leclercia sp. W6 TaxID=2282310 RepID=UPI000DF1E41E|nr:hypothetical protein [Leclercia sp. W6]AXF58487.1 hypothetical protein DVA43_02410 [Leclercia sp. W6]